MGWIYVHDVAHPDIPTFTAIPSKALRSVARCYHFVLDNLAARCWTDGDSFTYGDWHAALMHTKRRKAMEPQGDHMDLLQQLAHLDDDLGRKLWSLCSRLLAVTHEHNHVGSPDSHSASSRQEEAFARLLYLLPVMLTANRASANTKAKEVSATIIKNCKRFQLIEWEALCVFHQEAAQARNAALTKQSLAMPASTMQAQSGTPPPSLATSEARQLSPPDCAPCRKACYDQPAG